MHVDEHYVCHRSDPADEFSTSCWWAPAADRPTRIPRTLKSRLATADAGLPLPPTCLLVHAVLQSANEIGNVTPRVVLNRTAASKNSNTDLSWLERRKAVMCSLKTRVQPDR